ncbi:MAG: GNAT family N-acetyltransferase [Dehalococcoidales bacterium]|jgi:N-acetylglutamate synthase-like GNAT family acetyltransferase
MIIRKATEKDIPRLLELYRQLSFNPVDYKSPPPEECRRVLRQIQEHPGYSLLVAEENGEAVGTTVLAILPGFAHDTASFGVIEYVVVDEKCRSRGIGKELMEYCLARAREAGCYKVILTSDKRRERAHKFYRELGFEASAEGFRYYF